MSLWSIFSESFLHLLFPLFFEITLPAMRAFGKAVALPHVAAAWGGAMLAVFLLHLVGRLLRYKLMQRIPERLDRLSKLLGSVVLLMMLVVNSPLGMVIALSSGLLAISATKSLLLAGVGLWLNYAFFYGVW